MTGHPTTGPATDTWQEVIALLVEAADHGYREAQSDPARHSTALWADNLASSAIALLPPERDHLLDDVVLEADIDGLGMDGLIQAAQAATSHHPIEQFPPGASAVILALGELAAQVRT